LAGIKLALGWLTGIKLVLGWFTSSALSIRTEFWLTWLGWAAGVHACNTSSRSRSQPVPAATRF